jgi:hypothetical protein
MRQSLSWLVRIFNCLTDFPKIHRHYLTPFWGKSIHFTLAWPVSLKSCVNIFSPLTQSRLSDSATNSMEQSPLEADSWSSSLEMSCLLRYLKVYYRVQNSPSPTATLSQMNPIHAFIFYFFEIHIYIILPSTPRSPKWSLCPSGFLTKILHELLSSIMHSTLPPSYNGKTCTDIQTTVSPKL